MKTVIILLAASLITTFQGQAQDFKLAKSSGTLDISELNHVTIEGNNGNEIIFTNHRDNDDEKDVRSKGLRAITGSGLEDNTGIGIYVADKGDVVEVRQLKKMDGPEIKISVPKGVSIKLEHSSPFGGDIDIKNVEGKVELSTVHNSINLENVTGPLIVKTVHGTVEAVFTTFKSAVSISSTHGPVDITLPVASKANLTMQTGFGEILVDPDFKIEIDKGAGLVRYSNSVSGKLNGGGLTLDLSAEHNNVYLRKK